MYKNVMHTLILKIILINSLYTFVKYIFFIMPFFFNTIIHRLNFYKYLRVLFIKVSLIKNYKCAFRGHLRVYIILYTHIYTYNMYILYVYTICIYYIVRTLIYIYIHTDIHTYIYILYCL